MKIHYISCHSVLEYEEVQMLLDMGHNVFSNGAYSDPNGHFTLPRPALKGATDYLEYRELAARTARTQLPPELIEPFDTIIVMHTPEIIMENWPRIRHKNVIWRSIGQSVSHIEQKLSKYRADGLKVVRYSPKEQNIPNYMGEDAMIRFYKDEDQYSGWNGSHDTVVNFTQSLKGRHRFVHYDEIMGVIQAFDGKIYGTGNEDLGGFNGGNIPYQQQLEVLRNTRCVVYGGTWPAPYTLTFMEALMMGTPIVAISKKLAHLPEHEQIDFYEVEELLNQVGGCVADTVDGLKAHVARLLVDKPFANEISQRQRKLALEIFSKKVITEKWREFLNG